MLGQGKRDIIEVMTPSARAPDQLAAGTGDRVAFVEQIMGMPISLHVRGPAARGAGVAAAAALVFAELREVDALFSTYRPDSQVSRIDAGTLALSDAHALVQEVCELAVLARARTGGLFDVHLPIGERRVFDPSGLVKGWAVERASRHLGRLQGHDFCLNAGGDATVGCWDAAARPWRVGVQDPRTCDALLAVVERRDGAVATSGTAARGEHLVDPRDGSRPAALLSVTVVGPSLTWADVLATAAFVRGTDAAQWLRGQVGYEALVVHADGRAERTPGLQLAGVGAPLTPPTGGGQS